MPCQSFSEREGGPLGPRPASSGDVDGDGGGKGGERWGVLMAGGERTSSEYVRYAAEDDDGVQGSEGGAGSGFGSSRAGVMRGAGPSSGLGEEGETLRPGVYAEAWRGSPGGDLGEDDLGEGEGYTLLTLVNTVGMTVSVADLGATLVACRVPDARGVVEDVVLGFDGPGGYLGSDKYHGATCGRVCNRVGGARFVLRDGRGEVEVEANDAGGNALHGGPRGWDRARWSFEVFEDVPGFLCVAFLHESPEGDAGYPATVGAATVYFLARNACELIVRHCAEIQGGGDRATPVNMTNHAYWNLAGVGAVTGVPVRSARNLRLEVCADYFTPLGPGSVPTGEVARLEAYPELILDGTAPLGEDRFDAYTGRGLCGGGEGGEGPPGIDHNYVLAFRETERPPLHLDVLPGVAKHLRRALGRAASLSDPASGRRMEVWTDKPGMQVYTANYLDGQEVGKGGARYGRHDGVCLEAQHFPDAPNKPHFPGVVLDPSGTPEARSYSFLTVHRFFTDAQGQASPES